MPQWKKKVVLHQVISLEIKKYGQSHRKYRKSKRKRKIMIRISVDISLDSV